jgi:hypothetical protein
MSHATPRPARIDDSPFLSGSGERTVEPERHERAASQADAISRRPAGWFPPRLEISPLTIRPEISQPDARLPIC